MSKYKFKVTIEKEIEIELKDELFTPEFMEESEKYMYGFTTLNDHAKHIAQFQARFGDTDAMDGYCGMEPAIVCREVGVEDVEVEDCSE